MDESTLLKSGEISIQEKRLLKSVWVNKFCVLHKKTADSHAYMELYDDQEAFKHHKQKNKKCEKKIELQNVRGVKCSKENTGKGLEHHIEIKLKFHQKHNLMLRKESDFDDWFAKFNSVADITERGSGENSASYSGDTIDSDDDDDEDDDEVITLNEMYASTDTAQRFEVEVEPSDLAKLCGIEGKMILLVGINDIAFEDPNTKRVKYSFQLAWMRRFGKYKTQSFNFEVGRKCPNGEGAVTCKTASAKLIHKTVTQKSASRSKLVIPHPHTEEEKSVKDTKPRRLSASSTEEKQPEPPPPIKERQATQIGQPLLTNNLGRKHPGKANTPILIPIVRTSEDENFKKPITPPHPARRGSKSQKSRSSGKDSPIDEKAPSLEGNGHARPTSYKVAVSSGDFAKELEQKLHVGIDESEKVHELGKKESVRTKEDKKREKEEKKERERREKEEKKEKERLEKERKLREKEEKKSGKKEKNRESNKSQDIPSTQQRTFNERIYDEPEITSTNDSTKIDDPSSIYDEATSPFHVDAPAEYAQSVKRAATKETEDLYDEAVSDKQGKKIVLEKVEYAEPYSKKGGVPVQQEPAMYADVKTVEKDAWKKLGRKDEEMYFEEDYSNIKSARESVQKQAPPPIPVKNYDEDDDSENMYNTVDLKQPKPKKPKQPKKENLYGMASAKEVGPLPVAIPDADYPSDSGESVEEGTYDDPQYEHYEAPADVRKESVKKPKVIEAYEDAVVPVKPPTPIKKTQSKKVVPQELIYEEVS